ncbi:MAG: SpoIIE family protein phosphatase [Clostridiales bacterium]|nr:SpoIIE family protein phosphatase [Clostridiales bacterium]
MRRTFQRRLLVLMAAAFAVTLLITWLVQTGHARKDALELIDARLADAQAQIAQHDKNLESIRQSNDKSLTYKLHTLRWILSRHPEVAQSSEELAALLPVLDVDQLHIIDGSGIITATTYAPYLGYSLSSAEQSSFFLPILKDPFLVLIQPATPTGHDRSVLMQFSATGIPGRAGMVQIGDVPERLAEAAALADIKNLAPGFAIGNHGAVIVLQRGLVVSAGERELMGLRAEDLDFPLPGARSGQPFSMGHGVDRALCLGAVLGDYLIIGMLPFTEIFAGRNETLLFVGAAYLLLFVSVFILVSRMVDGVVIQGIRNVNASLARITKGNLETLVEERGNAEFRALSDGINATVSALKQAITDARERIDTELALAREVQLASLPRINTLSALEGRFRLGALLKAAREVGGDFYDFFPVPGSPGRKLALIIADVSGKGIPGALFMMRVKTQLQSDILGEGGLAEAVAHANRKLCQENEAGFFVTAFVAIWDCEGDGWLDFVNAGHNPPLLARLGEEYSFLFSTADLVLGAYEETVYHVHRFRLLAGDKLLLYTDGVTEAEDIRDAFFTSAGLKRLMDQPPLRNLPAEMQAEALMQSLGQFAGAREQADDITLMALDILSSHATLPWSDIPLEEEQTETIQSLVRIETVPANPSPHALSRLHVIVDEVFSNMVRYASSHGNKVMFCCELVGQEAVLRFRDRGEAFDPLSQPLPDISLPSTEREAGGLGLMIIRKLCDHAAYSYEEGENRLIIRINLARGPANKIKSVGRKEPGHG